MADEGRLERIAAAEAHFKKAREDLKKGKIPLKAYGFLAAIYELAVDRCDGSSDHPCKEIAKILDELQRGAPTTSEERYKQRHGDYCSCMYCRGDD